MLLHSKVNASALRKQCFQTRGTAFLQRFACISTPKSMIEKGGRGVEEKSSIPPRETPLYKGFLEEKVEVEEKMQKKIGDYILVDANCESFSLH